MLQGVLHVGKRVKLQKLRRARQILTSSVKVVFEVFKLPPQLLISRLLAQVSHESRVYREVDLQIELKLLANKILLSEHDGDMTVPKSEEVVSLATIESLAHLLDGCLGVLGETPLKLPLHVLIDFLVEHVGRFFVALFLEELQDRIVDVLLRGREVVKIDTSTATISLPQVVPVALFASTGGMAIADAVERLRVLNAILTHISIRLLVPIYRPASVHLFNLSFKMIEAIV